MTIHTLIFTQTSGMAWALARGMGTVQSSKKDHLILDGAILFWIAEPLARHATPAEYQRDWKRYHWDQLPLLPEPKMQPTAAGRHLLEWLKTLAFVSKGTIKRIILAPAPEDSGYLRMQQALDLATKAGFGKGLDVWLADMQQISTDTLRPHNLTPWSPGLRIVSEQCRIHGDWLLGMNLTRLLTIAYPENLSAHCGRVTTAMLQVISEHPRPAPSPTDCHFSNLQGLFVDQGHLPEAVILTVQWLYERGVITWPFGQGAPRFVRFPAQNYPSPLHHQITAMIHGSMPLPQHNKPPKAQGVGALLARLGAYPTAQGVAAIGRAKSRHKNLERLIENGLVQVLKHTVSLTSKGEKQRQIAPPVLRDPLLLVVWEQRLQAVQAGSLSSSDFFTEVRDFLVSSKEFIRSREGVYAKEKIS